MPVCNVYWRLPNNILLLICSRDFPTVLPVKTKNKIHSNLLRPLLGQTYKKLHSFEYELNRINSLKVYCRFRATVHDDHVTWKTVDFRFASRIGRFPTEYRFSLHWLAWIRKRDNRTRRGTKEAPEVYVIQQINWVADRRIDRLKKTDSRGPSNRLIDR